MASNSYSGQFSQIRIADAGGALNDLTAYLRGAVTVHIGADDQDLTGLAADGAPAARRQRRGADTCTVRASFFYHPTVAKVLRQVVGSTLGFLVQCMNGANTAPTLGDEVFAGTMTLLEFSLTGLQPGQDIAIEAVFVPADGGAIRPQITMY